MVPKPHPPSRPGSNTTFLLSIILLLTHTDHLAEFPMMRPVIEQMGAGPDVVAPALTRAPCTTNGAPPPPKAHKMHHHGQSHDVFAADADLARAASRGPMWGHAGDLHAPGAANARRSWSCPRPSSFSRAIAAVMLAAATSTTNYYVEAAPSGGIAFDLGL